MNYRHAFHAGNFADLAKHAALDLVLDRLLADSTPLLALDTHAGAGLYDLDGAMARKSGEAEAGVIALMADPGAPAAFDGLKAAVRRANPRGGARLYPGSPLLIAQRLRASDLYVGAELQPETFAELERALAPFGGRARAARTDGYALAMELAAADPRRLLVLIDAPFERADDYDQAAASAASLLRCNRNACLMIWTPLKDLETFDGFIRRLEVQAPAPALVAEIRLGPLDNPLKMNGCGLVFINEPKGLAEQVEPALSWIAERLGQSGAQARLWRTMP